MFLLLETQRFIIHDASTRLQSLEISVGSHANDITIINYYEYY